MEDYDSLRPKVVSIAEFANGDTTVCADLRTITVHFDRPLSDRGYSIYYGSLGKSAFVDIAGCRYVGDNSTLVIDVATGSQIPTCADG